MGDADVAQNMLPNDNVERLLDEALGELDEEMDRLFSFINLLHIRLCYATLEMVSLRKVSRCFSAFKLFVIPVVLAMGIVYITAGLTTSNSIQHALEPLIMILMYASMCIGLPVYTSSLWNMCFEGDDEEEKIFLLNREIENDDSVTTKNLTLNGVQESLQNIRHFQALSRSIYQRTSPINARSVQEDRSGEEDQEREDSLSEGSDGSDGFKVGTLAAYNNKKVRSGISKIIDLVLLSDSDDSHVDTGAKFYNELDEFYVLNHITGASQEDLSMKDDVVETGSVLKKPTKHVTVGKTRSRRSLRTITIQNIGDGSNVAYKKDVCCNTAPFPWFEETTYGM